MYFDPEWEHVFLRLRFGEHYRFLREPGLDPHRLALYRLALHLSLVRRPARRSAASGDRGPDTPRPLLGVTSTVTPLTGRGDRGRLAPATARLLTSGRHALSQLVIAGQMCPLREVDAQPHLRETHRRKS